METAVTVHLRLPEHNVHLHTHVSPRYPVSSLPFYEVLFCWSHAMKMLPETVCFQPLSVEEGKRQSDTTLETRVEEPDRQSEHWKRKWRNKSWCCAIRTISNAASRLLNSWKLMRERLVRRGKMGQGFLFFCYWKTTKAQKQKLRRKHSGGLQGGDTGPFPRKMCASVSSLIGKNVPWSLIFHCHTSIDGTKNNLWDIQSVPTSDESQSRPQASGCDRMFINSASVTSVGATQIIGNDWEIMKTSADLPLPWWPLTRWSPGDFDSRGADAAARLVLLFSPLFARRNCVSVFLFVFWGLIHLFMAQGVYSPLWPYHVGHMTHRLNYPPKQRWTLCNTLLVSHTVYICVPNI